MGAVPEGARFLVGLSIDGSKEVHDRHRIDKHGEPTAPDAWDPARLPIVGTPESRPGHPGSVVTDWSVDPEEYGYFLCKVWDEWLRRDVCKVLAVEHDGSVYACDHYVYPKHRRGNLLTRKLGSMVFDPEQVRFGYAKSEKLPQYYRDCSYLTDCWGECPKNRLLRTPDGEPGLNYLCPGLKKFFAHASREADRMAKRLLDAPAVARPRI